MVHPVTQLAQELKPRQLPLFTGRIDFLLVISIDRVHGPRHHRAPVADPYNLALEQMRLLAGKVWVSVQLSCQIATEQVLDAAGCCQLGWGDDRQLLPLCIQVRADIIGGFVYAGALRLHIRCQFLLAGLGGALGYVIVRFSADNLTPKFELLDLFGNGQSLQGFEDGVGELLAESHPASLQPFGLLHQIGHIAGRRWLGGLLFSSSAGLVEQSLHFLHIGLELVILLGPELRTRLLLVLDFLAVVLEQMITIPVIVNQHMLHHLHQVLVQVAVTALYLLELLLHAYHSLNVKQVIQLMSKDNQLRGYEVDRGKDLQQENILGLGHWGNYGDRGSEFIVILLKGAIFKVKNLLLFCQANRSKQMATKLTTFKPKKDTLPDSRSRQYSNMDNVRIVQKNLVFISGLPGSLAEAELLKSQKFFGRYGKVSKVVSNPQQPMRKPLSYQAYITYVNSLDAAIAITALDGFSYEDKPLKVSFGTTKYCTHFLRGYDCLNSDCFYLHEFDRKNEVLNRDTRTIFQQQNQQALDIVLDNLNEIAKRIAVSPQSQDIEGFPTLLEMIDFLIESKILTDSEFQSCLDKHQDSKTPKLQIKISAPPGCEAKQNSPKQSKLTKSNSFSTMASPYKSDSEADRVKQKQSKQPKQPKQPSEKKNIENLNTKAQQKVTKQQKTNVQKNQVQVMDSLLLQQEVENQVEEVNQIIHKRFLKSILKISEKPRSRLAFAGEARAQQVQRMKEIIQKHLIISS